MGSRLQVKYRFFSRAQGTIEYLVIIAVVVVIALVVVGLLINTISSFSGASKGISLLETKSLPIALNEAVLNPDGNVFLSIKNNLGENITIKRVFVGNTSVPFVEFISNTDKKSFLLDSGVSCSVGEEKVFDINFEYETVNGLIKKQIYPAPISIPCENANIISNVALSSCESSETKYHDNLCLNNVEGYWDFDSDTDANTSGIISDGVDDYIDTGIIAAFDVNLEIRGRFNTLNSMQFMGLENWPSSRYRFGIYTPGNYWLAGSSISTVLADTNIHTFEVKARKFYLDGGLGNLTAVNVDGNDSLKLFAQKVPDSQSSKFTLYSAKIWQNGSLVRNFYPKENSCLEELVNSQEYCNQGTGNFRYGNIPTIAFDSSTNSNDCNYNGDAYISDTNSTNENYLVLDGSGDYLSKTALASVSRTLPFSLSLWYKYTSAGVLFANTISSTDLVGCHALSSTNVTCGIYNGAYIYNPKATNSIAGEWNHLIFSYDGSSTAKIYLNGIEGASTQNPTLSTTIGFRIGANTANSVGFNGSIEDVILFNRALTEEEILEIYSLGR